MGGDRRVGRVNQQPDTCRSRWFSSCPAFQLATAILVALNTNRYEFVIMHVH